MALRRRRTGRTIGGLWRASGRLAFQLVVQKPPITIDWASIKWLAPWSTQPKSTDSAGQQQAAGPTPARWPRLINKSTLLCLPLSVLHLFGASEVILSIILFFARLWGKKRLAFYERTAKDYYLYDPARGL